MAVIRNPGIYIITNLVNNKYYIGESVNWEIRIQNHKNELRNNLHPNFYLQNSYNKYGVESFSFELLEECEEQFLASQENYWCNLLNTHNSKFGYNLKPTNPYGKSSHSKESLEKAKLTKAKNQEILGIGWWYTEEVKQKYLKSRKYLPLSREIKDKISLANLGKTLSIESRQKISIANKGKIRSMETKQKLSNIFKGKPSGAKGKKWSDFAKKLVSLSRKGKPSTNQCPVLQYDKEGNFIKEWHNITEALKFYNFGNNSGAISNCLNGRSKTAKGFKWKYKNKNNESNNE